MSEELIIRHVRLCECGKPAGHTSICRPTRTPAGLDPDPDVQRVDQAVEDQLADRAAGRYARRQREFREQRTQHLAGLSLLELCHQALAPAIESTVAAGSTEPSRSTGGHTSGPPRQQLSDDDPRVRAACQQLRRAAEQLIRLRWEDHGWETTSETATMLGEHKDLEILRCEGSRPREVVQLLGGQTAGGSRTVERVREEAGRCRWCGQHWTK